jgi:hypothetical protein
MNVAGVRSAVWSRSHSPDEVAASRDKRSRATREISHFCDGREQAVASASVNHTSGPLLYLLPPDCVAAHLAKCDGTAITRLQAPWVAPPGPFTVKDSHPDLVEGAMPPRNAAVTRGTEGSPPRHQHGGRLAICSHRRSERIGRLAHVAG